MSLVYSARNLRYQDFPFRNPLMHYILNNLTFDMKEKVAQTCKLFASCYPYDLIIDKLEYSNSLEVNGEPITNILHNFGKRIWLKNSFSIGQPFINLEGSLTNFIVRCTAKKLFLCETIVLKDFEILTKEGTLEYVVTQGVVNSDGNLLSFDDIVVRLPNAHTMM